MTGLVACCLSFPITRFFPFFFFNDTATTEIYTLSLHDALPISRCQAHQGLRRPLRADAVAAPRARGLRGEVGAAAGRDRKSTRLNSSHSQISYAVFCLKKKTRTPKVIHRPRATHLLPANAPPVA